LARKPHLKGLLKVHTLPDASELQLVQFHQSYNMAALEMSFEGCVISMETAVLWPQTNNWQEE
jgi:hypothetical protein